MNKTRVLSIYDFGREVATGNLEEGCEYVVINKKNLKIVAWVTAKDIDKLSLETVIYKYQELKVKERNEE